MLTKNNILLQFEVKTQQEVNAAKARAWSAYGVGGYLPWFAPQEVLVVTHGLVPAC